MNTIGVLLLTAATATGGLFGRPHAGGMGLLRAHAVADGPAPPGGPINAAALSGPGGPGGQPGRRFPNTKSQVFFVDPAGMKIGWQTSAPNGERVYLPGQLTVPARYNFAQGYIYRLKLTDIHGRPGLQLYPTIEVAPSTPATDAYLTHNPIPAQFTEEDFDQVTAGNFVTKVIYLPDPKFQELAIAGVETLVSTRLEPGVDPILEADRRGTILMIIRVGAIDLEMPASGASSVAPGGAGIGTVITPGSAPGTVLPPGSLPPGTSTVAPPPPIESVPVDNAPVSPAPTTTPPTPPAAEPPKPNTPEVPAPTAPAEAPAPEPAAPADAPKGSL